jgi:hypothetical protein
MGEIRSAASYGAPPSMNRIDVLRLTIDFVSMSGRVTGGLAVCA